MEITLLVIGKSDKGYVKEGIAIFEKRLKRYIKFSMVVIPDIKGSANMPCEVQKTKEGEAILSKVSNNSKLILLDENGLEYSSVSFSKFLGKEMVNGTRGITFVIGGPYGFSETVYKRANAKISLSKMTFSHQMVRMIFIEQLYRSMTIMRNEPYHHV